MEAPATMAAMMMMGTDKAPTKDIRCIPIPLLSKDLAVVCIPGFMMASISDFG